ncbi:MAG TPA: helix-turn-helix transcriptional regulator [Candidatus Limnocylindrales bacterium]|jgi:transcriptional regulator GlxA family with amidase domain|nr:helix-turn-helix transcriptional regulator [Candidatus Limnocylindrales bacterium]
MGQRPLLTGGMELFSQREVQTREPDYRVSALLKFLSAEDRISTSNVESIAFTLNVSKSYLRFLFKNETGIPLSRYLKHLKLQRAHEMLCASLLSVKEVMAHVGVDDHSHFARDYKRQFGESPSETRLRSAQAKTIAALSRHKIINSATNKALSS